MSEKACDSPDSRSDGASSLRLGTLSAFAAYVLWGLLPVYWKQLKSVDPVQILCHRIVWSAVFAIVVLAATRRLGMLAAVFKDGRRRLYVAASGTIITANWGIYIWAVNTGHVTESSLGYFINPLVAVAFGALFFRERLDRWTSWSVALATLGVIAATVMLGTPPWISLALATTFALYGAVKKGAGLDPVAALAAETIVVLPLAIAYLAVMHATGRGALGGADLKVNVMLVLAGVATAVPMIAFAAAAIRIPMQLIGFIQYVSPALQLALGLAVFGERLTAPIAVALATAIAAGLMYALTRRRAGD